MLTRSGSEISQQNPRDIEQLNPQWRDVLENRHIIAAVRNDGGLAAAEKSATETVYLLYGNTLNVADLLKRLRGYGKFPLVNLDLLTGFSRDSINAEYCEFEGGTFRSTDVVEGCVNSNTVVVQRMSARERP